MTEVKHSPLPWKQTCFLVTSATGSHVTHTGMGNLPPSRSAESEANAAFIVHAANSHDGLKATVSRLTATLTAIRDDDSVPVWIRFLAKNALDPQVDVDLATPTDPDADGASNG